jgi:hypothetical protein
VTRRLSTLTLLVLMAGLAGCSKEAPTAAPPSGSGMRLTAALTSPTDVTLTWQGGEPGAAGHIVEFATAPGGEYTILQFAPPAQTSYRHPDLMPETTFYYRLRPFYGPASAPVGLTMPSGPIDESVHEDDSAWADPRTVPGGPSATKTIRDASVAAGATPTNLKALVVRGDGVKLTWTDNAADEEGYLIEVKAQAAADFAVAAVVDRDINSVGMVTVPGEDRAAYRVRPYLYGTSSNVVHEKTGKARR